MIYVVYFTYTNHAMNLYFSFLLINKSKNDLKFGLVRENPYAWSRDKQVEPYIVPRSIIVLPGKMEFAYSTECILWIHLPDYKIMEILACDYLQKDENAETFLEKQNAYMHAYNAPIYISSIEKVSSHFNTSSTRFCKDKVYRECPILQIIFEDREEDT